MNGEAPAGPLAGLRVVELSEGVAGPMAARLLGDAGADVVKVELPAGDRTRGWAPVVDGVGAAFGTLNRNKRSIVVDPRTPQSVTPLAEQAEILIIDAPLADELSLDISGLMETNSQLIVCVISGWGPEGPWADRPGADLPAQLASETTTAMGRLEDEPVRMGTDHAGMQTALYAVQAITAALIAGDGGGQRIDISLFGSLMNMRSTMWVALSNPDEWWGFHVDTYVKPPEYNYSCKDRRVYFSVGRAADKEAVVRDLKMEFVLDDPRWPLFKQDSGGGIGRYQHLVHDMWDRGLSQWTYEQAQEIISRHGGWVFPCHDHDEFIADGQTQHMGIITEVTDDHGRVTQDLRPVWQLSKTPASIRLAAPRLDQHGQAIREEVESIE